MSSYGTTKCDRSAIFHPGWYMDVMHQMLTRTMGLEADQLAYMVTKYNW